MGGVCTAKSSKTQKYQPDIDVKNTNITEEIPPQEKPRYPIVRKVYNAYNDAKNTHITEVTPPQEKPRKPIERKVSICNEELNGRKVSFCDLKLEVVKNACADSEEKIKSEREYDVKIKNQKSSPRTTNKIRKIYRETFS